MMFSGQKPLFEEIADYYRRMISLGVYQKDQMIPSVRETALALKVNPNTVVRAYNLLQEEGIIYVLPKKGFFVAKSLGKDLGHLKDSLSKLLKQGYREEDILEALKEIKGGEHD